MIFIFNAEERRQLEKLDKKDRDAINSLVKIIEDHGKNSEQYKTARNRFIQDDARRKQRFISLVDEMDARRFNQLQTPADIIADGKKQAADAIIYCYSRIMDNLTTTDKARKIKIIVNMAAGGLHIYPNAWNYESIFNATNKRFNPAIRESTLKLDAAGMNTYILRAVLPRHLEALEGDPGKAQLLHAVSLIINSSQLTTDNIPEGSEIIQADSAIFKAYMPMYHSKAIDAFSILDPDKNNISGSDTTLKKDFAVFKVTTKDGDYTFTLDNYHNQKSRININVHKLLSVAISEFTFLNNAIGNNSEYSVVIPFREYARNLGYKIDRIEQSSQEAAALEKDRVKKELKQARKKIINALDLLLSMRCTWTESSRGTDSAFTKVNLFESVSLDRGYNGYIRIEFSRKMAEFLKKQPLFQYPRSLLDIKGTKPNVYRIGLKMAQHNSMNRNQIRGTANRLKVKNLLAVTTLPTMESLQSETTDNGRQWITRIKTPFENALKELTGSTLTGWNYLKPNTGEPLTADELEQIKDYNGFINIMVQFELMNAPDHGERIAKLLSAK